MSTVYTFEWPRACQSSVYVTGTFDNWTKSTRMTEASNGKYTATLEVPRDKKILFKFVVDGAWVTIPEFRIERDNQTGIENNVLYPDDFLNHDEELVSTFTAKGFTLESPLLAANETSAAVPHQTSYQSETETTMSFSNVSGGEFSPFEQYEADSNYAINTFALSAEAIGDYDYDDDVDVENLSDDLVSSAQITLSGTTVDVPPNIGPNRPTLVNLQEGNRQVRYFTSMSLLNKFTDYFK